MGLALCGSRGKEGHENSPSCDLEGGKEGLQCEEGSGRPSKWKELYERRMLTNLDAKGFLSSQCSHKSGGKMQRLKSQF